MFWRKGCNLVGIMKKTGGKFSIYKLPNKLKVIFLSLYINNTIPMHTYLFKDRYFAEVVKSSNFPYKDQNFHKFILQVQTLNLSILFPFYAVISNFSHLML